MRATPARHLTRGATLIEVLTAMLLLAIGVVSMTTLQAQALQLSQRSEHSAKAALLSQDLIERVRAHGQHTSNLEVYATDNDGHSAGSPCRTTLACAWPDVAAAEVTDWQATLAQLLPSGRGHIEAHGLTLVVWVAWREATPLAEEHPQPCPTHLQTHPDTRCTRDEVTL